MEPKQFIVFAIPTYTNTCATEFASSLAKMSGLLVSKGVQFAICFLGGNCFIDQARNILISNCVNEINDGKVTDIFFLDDDVGFPATAVWELINRPEDIVFGAYPKKEEKDLFPITLKATEENKTIEENGLLLADTVCGGFLRIKRNVIDKMSEGEVSYPYQGSDGVIIKVIQIFESGYKDGMYWGEDVAFAAKAQKAGFELWCKADIDFTHRGSKMWRNNLKKHLGVLNVQNHDPAR